MTNRAIKINEFIKRLELLNPESEKYEEVYEAFKAFLKQER